jgi:hypothetical protein
MKLTPAQQAAIGKVPASQQIHPVAPPLKSTVSGKPTAPAGVFRPEARPGYTPPERQGAPGAAGRVSQPEARHGYTPPERPSHKAPERPSYRAAARPSYRPPAPRPAAPRPAASRPAPKAAPKKEEKPH